MSTEPTTLQSAPPLLAPQLPLKLKKAPAQLAEEQWVLILNYAKLTGLINENHPSLVPTAFTPVPDEFGQQPLVQAPIMAQINNGALIGLQMQTSLGLFIFRKFSELLQMDQAAMEYDLCLQELCGAFIATVMAPATKHTHKFVTTYGADGFTSFSKKELGVTHTIFKKSIYHLMLDGLDSDFDLSSLGVGPTPQAASEDQVMKPPGLLLSILYLCPQCKEANRVHANATVQLLLTEVKGITLSGGFASSVRLLTPSMAQKSSGTGHAVPTVQ
ncbi:hypothetical protein DXG01_003956 [Tephrocybe rancida]|nr:hypothetical protein DXG01_003956 [Tephrocybe rancida]